MEVQTQFSLVNKNETLESSRIMYNFVAGESEVCWNWVLVSFCLARNAENVMMCLVLRWCFPDLPFLRRERLGLFMTPGYM